MSTAQEQADGLARVMQSGVPYFSCIALSWAAFGAMIVQMDQLNRSTDSRRQKGFLWFLFALTAADIGMNLHKLIVIEANHFGDFAYIMTAQPLVGQPATPYVELSIMFLCHGFLINRCTGFARSFHGKLPLRRRLGFLALAVLAAASFAVGVASQYFVHSLGGLVSVQLAAWADRFARFHLLEAGWLASSLALDLGLTATISYDMYAAMAFGANDVGVGANVRQILKQLAALAAVNGTLLVAFQLAFLCVIMVDNTGWSNGALIFLPALQLLSLLTLVNLPRSTIRVQASRRQSFFHSSSSPGSPTLPLFVPPPARQPLSPLERGRRKLGPVGKWGRRIGRARSQREKAPPAAPVGARSGGRVLGLEEMLAGMSCGSVDGHR